MNFKFQSLEHKINHVKYSSMEVFNKTSSFIKCQSCKLNWLIGVQDILKPKIMQLWKNETIGIASFIKEI
jgi:hypothetical protein